ncbi:DUF6161 domain-containing protein [Pseudophaeobacter sp.]|uniref:DUF6161 domain-containing protein n=1 Tax=Pseudophaeobacter sp. TaxID=1971739 RepID=UPI00405839D2
MVEDNPSKRERSTDEKGDAGLEARPIEQLRLRPSDTSPVEKESASAFEPQANLQDLQTRYSAYRELSTQMFESMEKAKKEQNRLLKQYETAKASIAKSIAGVTKELDTHHQKALEDFAKGLDAAQSAFTEQQAIRAPVDLWKEKQQEHVTAKATNFAFFVAGLLTAAGFVIALIYLLATQATYVEGLLAPVGCDPSLPGSDCGGFSLKGTLLAAGVLTLFTLLLWFIRLQMKLYLAERHLALDARERLAFAQSYLGLVREGDVSEEAREQRALVYAALFRPASDGTVREEGGLDPSFAAALSKFLMRPG